MFRSMSFQYILLFSLNFFRNTDRIMMSVSWQATFYCPCSIFTSFLYSSYFVFFITIPTFLLASILLFLHSDHTSFLIISTYIYRCIHFSKIQSFSLFFFTIVLTIFIVASSFVTVPSLFGVWLFWAYFIVIDVSTYTGCPTTNRWCWIWITDKWLTII